MINEDNKTEIIDQYLKGTLNPELVKEVEERIQIDAAFRHEVALQERIIRTIRESERTFLHKELDHMFDETLGRKDTDKDEPPIIPLAKQNRNYAVAAVVALLIVAGVAFWWNGKQSSEQEVRYMAVNLPAGSRGTLPASVADSIPMLIISHEMLYDFHYQFDDTLKLYGYFQQKEMLLIYEPTRQTYELKIDGQYYPLSKTETITPLQP